MAYCKSIEQQCSESSCVRLAVVEVLNNRNVSYGIYCGKHGGTLQRQLQADEDKEPARAEGR